jgi:molybdate transport system permease protein
VSTLREAARTLPSLTAARLLIALACAVAAAFVAIPLIVLATHTSPGALLAAAHDPVVLDALRVSLVTTAISLAVVVLVGTPVAVALARGRFPGRTLLDALVGLPLVLPPVVAGLALLLAFSRSGPLGQALQPLGAQVPLTEAAVVLAQCFVAGPFYVYAVAGGLAGVDRGVEEVAATLRASPWHTFRTVTLPLVRPALAYGMVLSGARALGEFGATITVAGNLQGRTQTMPTAIYLAFERDPDGAVALAVILAVVSFVLLLGVRGLRLARAAV